MSGSPTRWELSQPIRYPDPDVVVLDKQVWQKDRPRQRRESSESPPASAFTEGPVWFGDGRYLLFSDIPNDRILRWDETTGGISEFETPRIYANGNTRDRQGRLLTCEHDTQRLTRTEYDGTPVVTLADSFEGCRSDRTERRGGEIRRHHLVERERRTGRGGKLPGYTAPQELPFRLSTGWTRAPTA